MTPTAYDYRDKDMYLQPKLGNTVALNIYALLSDKSPEADFGVYFKHEYATGE